MSVLLKLSSLALKGAAEAAGDGGLGAGGQAALVLVTTLRRRFVDHSARLTRALERSGERAWRAAELALAGSSWWDRCKLALSGASERAFRDQVQAFLAAHPLDGLDGHGPDFRGQCVVQLQAARKAGLLTRGKLDPDELAAQVGDLSRFGDRAAVVEAEYARLNEAGAVLRRAGYDALAAFVELRPAGGPPLLLSAMRYFFQREVEADRELFQGLAYARLESLAEGQQTGFAGLEEAIDRHGDKLEALLGDVLAVVSQTRGDVLDIKAELLRQGQQAQDLSKAILEALKQHQLDRRDLAGQDSLSVRDEGERRLVKDLIKRYRSLPEDQRKRMPALLNAVGKLEVVAGDFESAERDFRELTTLADEPRAKAEAAHNLYRAALERRAWPEALAALKEAVLLDGGRFAPFPAGKFEAEKILGAGGFGVAFLCRNRHSGAAVVIKTLRRDGLDRDLGEVFREAQALEALEHPAIIRVRDCDYADAERGRPFLVMDYFAGHNLAEYVEKNGPIETRELLPLARLLAEGLRAAHGKGILHRDVKPANVLVRRSAPWEAKLIDFGLALRAESASSTLKSSLDRTLLGSSIAGTLEYAAPEQMGRLKGVAVGPYSDVYGFGKTCCYALFGTAQPTYQHWQQIPRELADLLGRCLSEQPKGRPQDFAAVAAELDRLMRPREVPAAVPRALPEAVPVLEAQPVEEPRRREPPRREEPRRRAEERPVRPAKKASGGSAVGVALVVLLLLAAAGAAVYVRRETLFGGRPSSASAVVQPALTINWPPKEWLDKRGPTEPKYEPISAAEMPQVIAQFREPKQENDWLARTAGRLALTEPTVKQKLAHEGVKRTKSLWDSKAAPKAAYQRASDADDIQAVSRGLNPLAKSTDQQAHKNLVGALKKWGTWENVDALIGLTQAAGFGADAVRLGACQALAHIKEPRGAEAVVLRLDDPWDGTRQDENGRLIVRQALTDFGPAAEAAIKQWILQPDPLRQRCGYPVTGKVPSAQYVNIARDILKDIAAKKPGGEKR